MKVPLASFSAFIATTSSKSPQITWDPAPLPGPPSHLRPAHLLFSVCSLSEPLKSDIRRCISSSPKLQGLPFHSEQSPAITYKVLPGLGPDTPISFSLLLHSLCSGFIALLFPGTKYVAILGPSLQASSSFCLKCSSPGHLLGRFPHLLKYHRPGEAGAGHHVWPRKRPQHFGSFWPCSLLVLFTNSTLSPINFHNNLPTLFTVQ